MSIKPISIDYWQASERVREREKEKERDYLKIK